MAAGVLIEKGPQSWQILQQKSGYADFLLGGTWIPFERTEENLKGSKVYVRVVKEDTGDPVIRWTVCETREDGTWQGTVQALPAGGLYRIETCLEPAGGTPIEWCTRGDMIHHIGVGDLFVIAGQSNSAGYGKDPIFDPPELGIHVLRNSGCWDLASHPLNESTGTVHEENREACNPGHSPYINFARQLKRELGYPIGLVQTALGGSPLSAWNPAEDGILYRNMLRIIEAAGGSVRGVLWYQGCSDCGEGTCDTYLERFENMVGSLRKDTGLAGLPFITVQLNRLVSPNEPVVDIYWGKIREAQRQAARKIQGVSVVPAIDSQLCDLIHNSSAANMVLGERMAKAALAQIFGRNCIYKAPEILSAMLVNESAVKLTFENVNERLNTLDVGAAGLPFTVMDETGKAGISGYEMQGKNGILLKLDRPLQGAGMIHGAYEANPKSYLPLDVGGYLPMLAFYGVEIEKGE